MRPQEQAWTEKSDAHGGKAFVGLGRDKRGLSGSAQLYIEGIVLQRRCDVDIAFA